MRPPPLAEPGRRLSLAVLLVIALVGCASQPSRIKIKTIEPAVREPVTSGAARTAGEVVAALAEAQLGQPYRYGGDGPQGFDCSGLALYVHEKLGIAVPRTALLQRQQSLPLDRSELLAGDLVFFTMGPQLLVDHVGVYVGDGQFVHAPRAGSPVRLSRLDDSVFAPRFAGGGRYWRSAIAP
jgi:murein DD-endopeptidase